MTGLSLYWPRAALFDELDAGGRPNGIEAIGFVLQSKGGTEFFELFRSVNFWFVASDESHRS